MKEVKILSIEDAITVEKENKTKVSYFIFNEFEVHKNLIPKGTVQEFHKHNRIEEVIYVTKGVIRVKWMENGKINFKDVCENSLVRVKKSIHTIENNSDSDAEFVVFRMVPDGKDKREIIKNDKKVIEI